MKTIARIVSVLAVAFAASGAAAQVQFIQFVKRVSHVQTSATTTPLITVSNPCFGCPFGITAEVVGSGIAGISPPVLTGPIDLSRIFGNGNNGVMAYVAGDGAWKFGVGGGGFSTGTQAALDSIFGNGTYNFAFSGGTVSLTLTGNQYPNVPLMSFSQGQWNNGKFEFDPSQPLTITTNADNGYGNHPNDLITLSVDGVIDSAQIHTAVPGWNTSGFPVSFSASNTNSVTIPANTFKVGQDYSGSAGFNAMVDTKSPPFLPGALAAAVYGVETSFTLSPVKTDPNAPQPIFPMTVTSSINNVSASASAQIQFRPQDLGTTQSVYVFAMAPISEVANPVKSDGLVWKMQRTPKDLPVECVLAQLSASGQLVGVSASTLQAFVTGVLSSQGVAVKILDGVPTVNIGGATFFVGYGTTGQSMLNGGINRAAVTIPGSQVCQPTAPQTGWWWNPQEDGRGFSVEKRGPSMFLASFLYDASGRSTWYVSNGLASLEGSLYVGDLLAASGGQTLGGTYPGFPTLTKVGTITATFNSATNGTIVWPGGTVPIQRQAFVPNGLALPPMASGPESGWWWNESEAGRGFFMEFQGDWLDIAGYMYDDQGNSVWYLTVAQMSGASKQSFVSNWWTFANGQTLTGAWKPNTRTSDHVAPVTVTFTGADTATITLPNGRSSALKRQRF